MFGKTNTFNAWQDNIRTITNCKRRTKQERKRKMLSKMDMNQPKITETLMRRESINSGKPNCEFIMFNIKYVFNHQQSFIFCVNV